MKMTQEIAKGFKEAGDAAARAPKLAEQTADMNARLRAGGSWNKANARAAESRMIEERGTDGRFIAGSGSLDQGPRGAPGKPKVRTSMTRLIREGFGIISGDQS
jgi:hypothetical protein